MKRFGALLILFILGTSAANAAVFAHLPTDREIVDRSDLVVVAAVRRATSRVLPFNGWVVTDYEMAVEETVKGQAGETITVTELGGVSGDRFTVVSDGAAYRVGERVMAFLRHRDDGTYVTTAMQYGKFEFARNGEHQSILLRETAPFAAEPARLADAFKDFVRGDAASYTAKLSPIAAALHPQATFVASDYTVAATDVTNATRHIRWPGQPGFTVHFQSNGGDPGGIASAAAEWTNEPSSGITIMLDPGAPPAVPTFDNQNGIYLNFTGTVPGGATQCDGALACTVEQGTENHIFNGEEFFSISDADIMVKPAGMGALPAVIIHEMGHAIGLRHSNEGTPFSTQAVMNSTASFNSLQQWDRDAADTVYGSGPPCQPVVIAGQPQDSTVPSGQSAVLQVQVTGTSPHFQWYEGTKPDTTTPVGSDSNSFTTPPVVVVKKYWVRITGGCGSADSNTVTVTPQAPPICDPPHITQQPAGGSVASGQTFTMSVAATGTGPFAIQWYAGQKGDKSQPVSGANAATFTTPALTQTTSYWVDLLNFCGEDQSNAATVTVTQSGPGPCGDKPQFTIQPQGGSGQSGQPAMLFALATGGAISYQWYRGNTGDTTTPLASQTASNARWVSQIYVDLLGRVPTPAESASLESLLTGGATRTAVATVVLTSAEYRTNLLGSFYALYLHRPASASDVAFFLPMFSAGFTDEQIAATILASPEYFTLSGGTNTAWIARLYNDVVGRAPSPADTNAALSLLGNSSRNSVALALLDSTEARSRLIQGWFSRFLRRSAASAEVGALLGATDEQAMAAILASQEYFNFPSLLITPVLTSTTSFWVRATNSCGPTDSATATISIPCDLPVIVTPPANASVNVGQSPALAVIANGATSYQWFVGSSGVETSPIAGATGPVLGSFPLLTVGTTQIWVKASNGCGSTKSAAATVTVNCAATVPTLTAPPTAPSSKSYSLSWAGNLQVDAKYELQESTSANFSAGVTTVTITDGTSRTIAPHAEVTKDTRFYYRVRSFTRCAGDPSAYSKTASVLVTAPLPRDLTNYSFAQPPCAGPPCLITQLLHIPPFDHPAAGKRALESGDQFSVVSDKPWMTVSPSSGNLPAEGADVTVTIDASQLGIGSTQSSLTVSRTPGTTTTAAGTGVFDNTPTKTTVPVSVSLVTPVTPKDKDGNAPPNALLVPAVAHADGIGTRFVSDLRLVNTAAQAITYDLTFTPSNADGTTSGKQLTLTAQSGETLALNDIVKDWYGAGVEGEGGIGTIEIRPRNFAAKTGTANIAFATVVSSRTYAVTAAGTFGQFIPALHLMNFLGKSSNSVVSLQQLAQSASYRTNLGLVEGLGQSADVVVKLLDDRGTLIAQRPLTLRPFEAQQTRLDAFFNGFTVNGAALPNITDGRVEVSVSSDSGRVSAYASVLDNATSDPLLVFPVDPATVTAKRFVVPGVAEFDNGFSNFHTDMRIYNAGAAAATVTLTFSGSTAQLPAVQRTIPAGQVLAIDNVLGSLWGATGGGAAIVTTDEETPLVVTARTFSRDANGGTFGQFIPGATASDAVGVGDRTLQVIQLEQSPSFRSNLGLVEVTGNPVTVEISGFVPDSKIVARTQVTLGGGEFTQLGSVFASMGFGPVYNGRISVRAIGGTGRVAAYGSVVDARTADPTYVRAE